MNDTTEHLDLRSYDIAEDKRRQLLSLFPEVQTEGGKIDFARLKLALGAAVDVGKERYGMNWPGKAECFKTIQVPSLGTLRPCREESVNFDKTANLIIEGDNLEVLKLLQKSYLGQVKMIYIDPPYNTGNDFIYPDNYSESLQTYLEYTGQVDAEGKKFSTNTDTDGRFHSKWMSMMWPRLYLARNLLRDDGVMFVSIDDNEVHDLIILMNEVFGEENHYATIVWQKKDTPANDAKTMSVTHEYLLAYQRTSEFRRNLLERSQDQLDNYKNPDNDPRGTWTRTTLIRKEVRPERLYAVKNARGQERHPPPGTSWRLPPDTFRELERDNRIWWGQDGDGDLPFRKRFLSEVQAGVVPITWWDYEFAGSNRNAKIEIRNLFENQVPFDTPKPSLLVRQLLKVATENSDLVLDFFAGSGTTAHAVLEQNREDGGTRKFILVQLPEPVQAGGADAQTSTPPAYRTIADITTERVRRVIRQMESSASDGGTMPLRPVQNQDCGFRLLRLAESNFRPWDAEVHDVASLEQQLALNINHVRPDRDDHDLLYEILVKSGYPPTTSVETLVIAEKKVFSTAAGALFICLERRLTLEVIRGMAEMAPERVVCLDAGFAGNDQLKANAVQMFRNKGVTSFKTV